MSDTETCRTCGGQCEKCAELLSDLKEHAVPIVYVPAWPGGPVLPYDPFAPPVQTWSWDRLWSST